MPVVLCCFIEIIVGLSGRNGNMSQFLRTTSECENDFVRLTQISKIYFSGYMQ